jgi:amino acid transporter
VVAPRTALWFGPGVALLAWALNFSVMYALATYWCGRTVLGWIATLGSAAIALVVLLRALRSTEASSDSERETRHLGRDVAIITALLALIAILLHGVAVLSLPACGVPAGSGLTIQHARAARPRCGRGRG